MKFLTAALAATVIGTAAMAHEVQVFKPNGETETFTGVDQVEPCAEPNAYAFEDGDGNVIAYIVDMPMIIRPEDKDKDEPDGPALPPKRRPFPDVTVSPGFSQNFTGGKINLTDGAIGGTFNVEGNTSSEEDDQ